MLKLTAPVGWTVEDMQCVAAMVRYHRGGLPETTASPFVGVSLKRRSDLLALTGILRLANAFDESHDHLLSDIEVELANESVVVSARGMQEFGPRQPSRYQGALHAGGNLQAAANDPRPSGGNHRSSPANAHAEAEGDRCPTVKKVNLRLPSSCCGTDRLRRRRNTC